MHFDALEIHDGKGRLQLCVHQRCPLRCWGNGQQFSIQITNVTLEHAPKDQILIQWEVEDDAPVGPGSYYAKVMLNSFEYFMLLEIQADQQGRLNSPLFRAEKRSEERILLFPTHQAFIYLTGNDEERLRNVVPLRKSSQFGAMVASKDFSLQLRLNDISHQALALRLPERMLDQVQRDWNGVVKLSIDGQAFQVKELKYLYHAVIMEKRSTDEQFVKMGFSFSTDDQGLLAWIASRKAQKGDGDYSPLFEIFIKGS